MINFNNVIKSSKELIPNELFNLKTVNKQTVTVFEDDDIIVAIVLSKKSHSRYLSSYIKFKKYKSVEKESSLQIKIDSNISIEKNINNITIANLVESCINSCNINGLEEVNFIKNGYSLEISKTSNRYVTIIEHINAISFQKRFSTLDDLFNYINYRTNFHSKVNIDFNVPDHEIDNIKRNIRVLETNSYSVFSGMMNKILSYRPKRSLDISQISFENVKKINSVVTFDLIFEKKDSKEYVLSCNYDSIGGMSTELPSKELKNDDIDAYHTLLYILNQIHYNYSGNFLSYVALITQHRKFKSKINSVELYSKLKQMNPETIRTKIESVLKKARSEEKMNSDNVDISSFNGYKRYVRLEGVMKNRKKCSLVVYAEKKGCVFEEYKISVEKNRINDDSIYFLSQYFI